MLITRGRNLVKVQRLQVHVYSMTFHSGSVAPSAVYRNYCEGNNDFKHGEFGLRLDTFICIYLADAFIQSDFQERALQSA